MNTKNTILVALALLINTTAFSQVGIGTITPDPSAMLDVNSTTKGFLPPRLTDAERDDIALPVKGLTIYNTTEKCLQWFDGNFWYSGCSGSLAQHPTNPVGTGSFSGKICFDIALNNDNINSCASLTARTPNQSDFTQTTTNTQTYTFTPSGTVSNVRFMYINTNGNVITAISGDNTGNNISTAVLATVTYNNNLNTLAAGLTNSNPLTADIYVIYNDGATNNGTDRQLKITPNVKDCECCTAKISTTETREFLCHNLGADISLDPHVADVGLQGAYIQWGYRGPNTTGDSRIDWQTAANDVTLGFAAAPTASNANSSYPMSSTWTSNAYSPDDAWLSTAGFKTANDPCPTGYRVPTRTEWEGVLANNTLVRTGTFNNNATNYGALAHYGPNTTTKFLTLPAAGFRHDGNGNSGGFLTHRGNYAFYWSSSVSSAGSARHHYILSSTSSGTVNSDRRRGMPIRCIAE